MLDLENIKNDFPFLNKKLNGKSIVFLDNSASTQKPKIVIDEICNSYSNNYSNVHRSSHTLSSSITEKYENSRRKVQQFISSEYVEEIIFTKGSTESINLVAFSLLDSYFKEEDEIVITEMEHHANIVPWQLISQRKKLVLKYAKVKDNGELDIDHLQSLISKKTKMLAITHCSNVLGSINPIKTIIKNIRKFYNTAILVDGAQSVAHQKVDVVNLGCDFYVFSSHKLYGPTGVGVLYAKKNWHNVMTPYQGGGDMIKEVKKFSHLPAESPYKFEAGTPNIVGVIGLSVAIDYINNLGFKNIKNYENALCKHAINILSSIPGLNIIGRSNHRSPIITFFMNNFHSSDLGTLLDSSGICVRVGSHCAQPLLTRFKVLSSVRASFCIYNTFNDIQALFNGLKKAIKILS